MRSKATDGKLATVRQKNRQSVRLPPAEERFLTDRISNMSATTKFNNGHSYMSVASRRASSGLSWAAHHMQHASIPENEELITSKTNKNLTNSVNSGSFSDDGVSVASIQTQKSDSVENYDRSVENSVLSFLASTSFSNKSSSDQRQLSSGESSVGSSPSSRTDIDLSIDSNRSSSPAIVSSSVSTPTAPGVFKTGTDTVESTPNDRSFDIPSSEGEEDDTHSQVTISSVSSLASPMNYERNKHQQHFQPHFLAGDHSTQGSNRYNAYANYRKSAPPGSVDLHDAVAAVNSTGPTSSDYNDKDGRNRKYGHDKSYPNRTSNSNRNNDQRLKNAPRFNAPKSMSPKKDASNSFNRMVNDRDWNRNSYSRDQNLMTPGINGVNLPDGNNSGTSVSQYNPISPTGMVSESSHNYMYYPTHSATSPGMSPSVSTQLSANAHVFIPTTHEEASPGLGISYMNTTMPHVMGVDGNQSYHQLSSYNTQSSSFVLPSRENKRITIIDPQRRTPVLSNEDFKRNVSSNCSVNSLKEARALLSGSESGSERSSYTPLLQSGKTAKDLSENELDGIVRRLTEHTPEKTNGDDEDDSDSVWSDSMVREQRRRIVENVIAVNQKNGDRMDDKELQKLLNQTLMQKLDPLEKLLNVLSDQLKNSPLPTAEDNTSDADDEGNAASDPNSASNSQFKRSQERKRRSMRDSFQDKSDAQSDKSEVKFIDLHQLQQENDHLRRELEEASRARERADSLLCELTNKAIINEKEASVAVTKSESFERELKELRVTLQDTKEHFSKEMEELGIRHEKEIERERELLEKECQTQKSQIQLQQEQILLLERKLEMAEQNHKKDVEKFESKLNISERVKQDIENKRTAELAWLRNLLDAKIEELDEQNQLQETVSMTGSLDKNIYADLCRTHNSTFLDKLKFGIALSHASDDFIEMLSSAHSRMQARGIVCTSPTSTSSSTMTQSLSTASLSQKLRQTRHRHNMSEHLIPFSESNPNIVSQPSTSNSRVGFGGLKDFKLSRAATIHGLSSDRKDVSRARRVTLEE
ncbi:hypothetical protein V1511DRAFT_509883 [Dipodascopsis uninucleata]